MSLRPWYNKDANYQTNAKSFMDYLARTNHFLEVLIEDYENFQELVNEELERIKFNAEMDVEDILLNWLEDGTLERIINETIFNQKLDTDTFEVYKNNIDSQLKEFGGIDVTNPPENLDPVEANTGDQSDNFNNIIQYASINNIENVYVPDGIYYVDAGSYEQLPDGLSGGIVLQDNVTLKLSKNTVIKALPSSSNGYNIIGAWRKKNIGVIGGRIVGDRNEHIGSTGEWGMGICILGCENIYIDTVTEDCWGDGVYIGGAGIAYPCKNLNIKKLESYNNRRQGISIVHLDGFNIDELVLKETNGTAPESGIDIEPNTNQKVVNGFINNILALNNNGAGVQIYADREGAEVNNIIIDKIITNHNRWGFLARRDKIKGVEVNTIMTEYNTQQGVRIADKASNIGIKKIVTRHNDQRGLGITEANNILIGEVLSENNGMSVGVAGNSYDCVIDNIIIKNKEYSDYGLEVTSSNNININYVKVDRSIESGVYLSSTHNSFINVDIEKCKKYPVRINLSTGNRISGVLQSQDFPINNTFSLIRLENESNENIITSIDSSRLEGYRSRYAVQCVNDSINNTVLYNNFHDSFEERMFFDQGDNNFNFNFPVIDELEEGI